MGENFKNFSKKKERNRYPPQNRELQTTQREEISREFCSYSSSIGISGYYFGLNIFELYSQEELTNLVRDPINNNKILRELALTLYGSNGMYGNTVDYMAAMPTLDKVIVSHGNNIKKKRNNKDKMITVLRTIKDKEFVRDALFKGMIEGVAFYYFETSNRPISRQKMMNDYDVERIVEINNLKMNVSIISLPTDFTRIVGIKNSYYQIAFNLDYFDNCIGEDRDSKLRKYPKEIREAYRKKTTNGKNWVVLDNTKTIVHKIRSKREEKWGRPLVLSAISDILYNDYFTSTKRNVLDEINNRVIYQTYPEGKDKGLSALTKPQQKEQHDKVKSAIMNKNNRGGLSFFSVAAGTKINSLDVGNTDIFDDKYESNLNNKIAGDLGIASSLLDGSGSGSYSSQENNLDLVSSQIFQWVEQIENELNKCISANIIKDSNNRVECKYLPITHVNKKNMVTFAKELYLQGKGSLTLWASACGISSDVFFALLDQELEENIEDKYPVHKTSYTLSDKQTGRPMEEDSKNPKTIQARINNTNNIPKPSTK